MEPTDARFTNAVYSRLRYLGRHEPWVGEWELVEMMGEENRARISSALQHLRSVGRAEQSTGAFDFWRATSLLETIARIASEDG